MPSLWPHWMTEVFRNNIILFDLLASPRQCPLSDPLFPISLPTLTALQDGFQLFSEVPPSPAHSMSTLTVSIAKTLLCDHKHGFPFLHLRHSEKTTLSLLPQDEAEATQTFSSQIGCKRRMLCPGLLRKSLRASTLFSPPATNLEAMCFQEEGHKAEIPENIVQVKSHQCGRWCMRSLAFAFRSPPMHTYFPCPVPFRTMRTALTLPVTDEGLLGGEDLLLFLCLLSPHPGRAGWVLALSKNLPNEKFYSPTEQQNWCGKQCQDCIIIGWDSL